MILNGLDYILLVPLLWAVFKGFKNGLIKEVFSLLALSLGIFITYKFSYFVEEKLDGMFAAHYIAFVITFFAVLIGVHFTGVLVEKAIKLVVPGFINRLLGICFGVAKWLFICSILLLMLKAIDVKQKILTPKLTETSILYPYVEKSTHFIAHWAGKNDINNEKDDSSDSDDTDVSDGDCPTH